MLAFAPGGRLLALVEFSGKVDVWDLKARDIAFTLKKPGKTKVAFSPEGDYLACCDSESISLFATRNWKKLWQVPTYWHHPVALAFSRGARNVGRKLIWRSIRLGYKPWEGLLFLLKAVGKGSGCWLMFACYHRFY